MSIYVESSATKLSKSLRQLRGQPGPPLHWVSSVSAIQCWTRHAELGRTLLLIGYYGDNRSSLQLVDFELRKRLRMPSSLG